MRKTILLTGATDGIGLETAKALVTQGHHVLLHGRNADKLKSVENQLSRLSDEAIIESYIADFSRLDDVRKLASSILKKHTKLDVLINNAGIFKTSNPITSDNLDVRFVVNTLAPYLLTQKLLPLLGGQSRVVNLSSAAQAPVDLAALKGKIALGDMAAYAQSKLAITMWSRHMALSLPKDTPVIVAVNPGSLLASKMVKEGFGVAGNDIRIGADILIRAAFSDEFADASGKYYDNDARQFAPPQADGLDMDKAQKIITTIEEILNDL